MAITFLQEKKRQRNLILILALVIIAILIIVWQGFLKEEEPAVPFSLPPSTLQEVSINWQILKDPQIAELQAFEEILPFEDEIGRENPFIPY